MRHAVAYTIAFILLSLSGILVYGQTITTQQITGTVEDPSGAVVPNATVVVTNTGTGIAQTVKSGSSGRYTVLDIPVGIYSVTVTAPGFKTGVVGNIHVNVGGEPSVPVSLQVGNQNQSVTVTSTALQVDTTTSEIGPLITSEEATQIQLNGRNYIQLLSLSPGVSFNDSSGFKLFGTYGVDGSDQSVNGVRTDSSNYFIDGVDNKDNGGGGNNYVNISPDALEQFRTAESSYDASPQSVDKVADGKTQWSFGRWRRLSIGGLASQAGYNSRLALLHGWQVALRPSLRHSCAWVDQNWPRKIRRSACLGLLSCSDWQQPQGLLP